MYIWPKLEHLESLEFNSQNEDIYVLLCNLFTVARLFVDPYNGYDHK